MRSTLPNPNLTARLSRAAFPVWVKEQGFPAPMKLTPGKVRCKRERLLAWEKSIQQKEIVA